MGRNGLDRYLDVVEESFGAAAAASEQVAADDLALAFLQDLDLAGALARLGALECTFSGRVFRPVVEVGSDYVVVDSGFPTVISMAAGRFRASEGSSAPLIEARSLVGLLRHLVRQGVKVAVEHGDGTLQGTLTRAGRDHLGVRVAGEEEIVPLPAVISFGLQGEQKWRF